MFFKSHTPFGMWLLYFTTANVTFVLRMAQARFTKIQRRKLTVFFRCVVISFIAWALFAVSNNYTINYKVGLEYVNVPENKAFHPLQSDSVRVNLRMSGWKLLAQQLKKDSARIRVDLSSLENRNYVVFSTQIGFVNRQFTSDKQVVSVSPDTLYFDFSKQTQRKVPVKALSNLNFRKQYGITGEVKTNPEHVTITGPLEDVANIEFIETDTIRGSQLDTDVRTVASLNRRHRTNITLYPTFAEVVIPVGEMTEKVLELPIRIEGAKKYTSVRTLPTKVKVTVLISLKDYSKWTSSDFEAVVDLSAWEEDRTPNLPVIITKKPEFCELISVMPQNVDFFVRK